MSERRLLRNLPTKLLALGIALLIWFALAGGRRERISERGYTIPLAVVNVPRGMVVASALPVSLQVRLRGPFSALRALDPAKLEAVIDLRGASAGERTWRLGAEDVNVPPEVEVLSISPAELRVGLDTAAEKRVPIRPAIVGKPAPGYRVAGVSADPPTALLTGAESSLARLSAATTDAIPVDGHSATLVIPATALAEAPGVRVREGQVVVVTITIEPDGSRPTPAVTPARAGR
ncbi:MAG TPA: CdaR family protein [Thermoanaerobaculia bacterium]